jgi:hypothetical protein
MEGRMEVDEGKSRERGKEGGRYEGPCWVSTVAKSKASLEK